MTNDQLNRLLNTACEIITSLEGYANEHPHYPQHNKELSECIENFFNEIKYSEELDAELERVWDEEEENVVNKVCTPRDGDDEAQDWNVFKNAKI